MGLQDQGAHSQKGITIPPTNQNLIAFKAFVYRGFDGFFMVFFDYTKIQM
jgi:hypothetical protein